MSVAAGSTAPPESGLWSDLDAATLLGSTAAPKHGPETPIASLLEAAARWLAFFRGLGLAAGGAASSAVAGAGLALLLFLAFTVGLTPPADTFSRPLSMDFSQADLVAQAVFLPEAAAAGDGLLPDAAAARDARFLAPGQAVDVWVELEVPRETGQGVAQVVAQLTSLDGRVAAKASRALVMRSDGWRLSALSLLPLRWLGLGGDVRRVRVPLFRGYREKKAAPFVVAQVAIKTRNPVWAAEVVSATVKVRLRLGLLRRAVYSLRPGPLWAPALGCAAAAMLLGGGAAALLFLGLLLYTGFGGGAAKAGSSEGAATSSVVSAADEVSSVSGVSEASSSVLRELEAEPAPRGGAEEPPSPHPAAAAAAERVERYLDALPGAGAAGLRARKPGAAPADSAMGSEPGLPRPRAKFA